MSSVAYYLLWLGAGLLATALASALIVRSARRRALRQAMAVRLLDALATYSEWVATQGRAVFFQATQESDPALQEVGALQGLWFPELQPQVQAVFEVHIRVVRFLRSQYLLRVQDAEAWFESDPDDRFAALWREHRAAVQSLQERLVPLGRDASMVTPFASAA